MTPTGPQGHLELRLYSAYPEFAEELLFAHGADAVRQEDEHDDPVLEPAPGETPLWRATVTCGYFPADTDLQPIIAAARSLLPDGATLRTQSRLIAPADWQDAWKQYVKPLPFGGGRLWICPTHEVVAVADAAIVVLDPGLAFGTGTHASTALCLEWLAGQDLRGKQVLDYGCGSGILAIAALKLGAAAAVCVDIDPQALLATQNNAAANGVDARVHCVNPEQHVEQAVDIVLANILAQPLIGLAPRLARCTRAGGAIALAGLLDRQAEEVRAAYTPWFAMNDDAHLDGWTRLAGRRHADS